MIELLKNQVDAFAKEGDSYQKIGMVLGSLNVRDKKKNRENFVKTENKEKNESTYKLAPWALKYLPSFSNWEHTSKNDAPLGRWKDLCMELAFGWEKLRIIG